MENVKIVKTYKISIDYIDTFQKFILEKYKWNNYATNKYLDKDNLDYLISSSKLNNNKAYISVWSDGFLTYLDRTLSAKYYDAIDYDMIIRKEKLKKLL